MPLSVKKASEYPEYTPRQVRVRMAEADMNQSEFAEYVGVNQPQFNGWLRGRATVSLAAVARIAEVYEALADVVAEVDAKAAHNDEETS